MSISTAVEEGKFTKNAAAYDQPSTHVHEVGLGKDDDGADDSDDNDLLCTWWLFCA